VSQLSAARLQKRYKARTVVHDVSLEVASGEVVGLLGPNGAGKTTCFYMIVGLVGADGGSIQLDGENLSRLAIHQRARRGLSYLPQEASIFRKLTVAENVRAILELQDLDPDTLSNRLDALLEDLSISHLAEAPAVSLSGDDEASLKGYWDKLSAGATITMPLEKAPWGDSFGMLTDKFGVSWMVNIAGSPQQ